MQKDALEYVKKCDKCQKHSPIIHQPATKLHPIKSPWPFTMWGLDIMGLFPWGSGSCRFLLVGTDYFTKWVEAATLVNIGEFNVKTFIWKNIITRFGIPKAFISDNCTQFKEENIQELCREYEINQYCSSVSFPLGNGLAEISNKVILEGLKKILEGAKGR